MTAMWDNNGVRVPVTVLQVCNETRRELVVIEYTAARELSSHGQHRVQATRPDRVPRCSARRV